MSDFPYDRDVDEAHEREHRASRHEAREPGSRRFPLKRARRVAEAILACLAPACARIEIAGSIRRGAALVKDIELVAIPTLARDLFGDEDTSRPTDLELLVEHLIEAGRLEPRLTSAGIARRGRRYQALRATRSGLGVDLFSVIPPASWGAQIAIRTGPADFSRAMVTRLRELGARLVDAHVVRNGVDVPTPTEEDFFRACGFSWVPPEERRA